MNKQEKARQFLRGRGLDISQSTLRGKAVTEVKVPDAADAQAVLAFFGEEGWSTSFKKGGTVVRAEVAL